MSNLQPPRLTAGEWRRQSRTQRVQGETPKDGRTPVALLRRLCASLKHVFGRGHFRNALFKSRIVLRSLGFRR